MPEHVSLALIEDPTSLNMDLQKINDIKLPTKDFCLPMQKLCDFVFNWLHSVINQAILFRFNELDSNVSLDSMQKLSICKEKVKQARGWQRQKMSSQLRSFWRKIISKVNCCSYDTSYLDAMSYDRMVPHK